MPTRKKPTQRWPDGGELFAELARRFDPTLSDAQARTLALWLFDSPYDPIDPAKWGPDSRRCDPRAVLTEETTVFCLMLQAWSDRAQWALSCDPDPASLRNYSRARQVLSAALQRLPGGAP